MSLLLLQAVGDGPVFLKHAKWHDLDSVFGLTCVSALLSWLSPAVLSEDIGVHQAGASGLSFKEPVPWDP